MSQNRHPTAWESVISNLTIASRTLIEPWIFADWGFSGAWASRLGRLLPVASANRHFNVSYVGNTGNGIRFQDRRERDFHAFRCGAQLGPEEFALADANGIGLLRHRVDGHGCVAIRYLAVRCGSDAFLAASM